MGEINIPRHQQEALAEIDANQVAELVDQAKRHERSGLLVNLRLANCGLYIGTRLDAFEAAIHRHRLSKSAKKRAETEYDLDRAGRELIHAVSSMKDRLATELKEREFFYVDDNISHPSYFTKNLSVRIGYRWRHSEEADWLSGSITFNYEVDLTPDYLAPRPTRKPNAAKQKKTYTTAYTESGRP